VHGLRLSLPRRGLREGGRATPEDVRRERRAEAEEALREDPSHVEALMTLARLDATAPREPAARLALSGHPEDPDAWAFLADSLDGPERRTDRVAAWRKAVELAPGRSDLLNGLAWELHGGGADEEARAFATSAAALAPHDPFILDTYAAVVAGLGRCPEALRVQRRAVALLPEGVTASVRLKLEGCLQRYERECGEPGAVPSGGSD
jgi:Flp pilus assembly protein TadD